MDLSNSTSIFRILVTIHLLNTISSHLINNSSQSASEVSSHNLSNEEMKNEGEKEDRSKFLLPDLFERSSENNHFHKFLYNFYASATSSIDDSSFDGKKGDDEMMDSSSLVQYQNLKVDQLFSLISSFLLGESEIEDELLEMNKEIDNEPQPAPINHHPPPPPHETEEKHYQNQKLNKLCTFLSTSISIPLSTFDQLDKKKFLKSGKDESPLIIDGKSEGEEEMKFDVLSEKDLHVCV